MNNIIINLKKEVGVSLSVRALAVQLRNKALEEISKGNIVTFDFKDINVMSTGFAFDLFASLFKILNNDFNEKIKLKLYDDNKEVIKNILNKALSNIV